jgi:hypothetical protein
MKITQRLPTLVMKQEEGESLASVGAQVQGIESNVVVVELLSGALISLISRDEINIFSFALREGCSEPDEIEFIVTERNDPDIVGNDELGVLVNGVPYVFYRGGPMEARDALYRKVGKREFGEVIRAPQEASGPGFSVDNAIERLNVISKPARNAAPEDVLAHEGEAHRLRARINRTVRPYLPVSSDLSIDEAVDALAAVIKNSIRDGLLIGEPEDVSGVGEEIWSAIRPYLR